MKLLLSSSLLILLLLIKLINCLGLSTNNTTVPSRDRNDKPYRVVCYWGSWAWYRPKGGQSSPETTNPLLCTHMIYGFAKLGDTSNKIEVYDPDLDLGDTDWESGLPWGEGMYRRYIDLRRYVNPHLTVLVSIGGWNEGSTKYSRMVSSPPKRRVFVESIVKFLVDNDFDGLDMDWEYPGFKAGTGGDDRTPGDPEDNPNFIQLLRELREAFKPYGFLLTAAVSAGRPTIDVSYNVPELSQLVDFINVMTYDFHGGGWDNVTGHNAPLYASAGATEHEKQFTVSYAIDYWLKLGADPKKLVMGMGTYGRTFTLANPANHGLGAPAVGKGGKPGKYTEEEGMLGYNEICESFQTNPDKWHIFRDDIQKIVYAVNANQWVGYDDDQSLGEKLQFLKQRKLSGAMVWSIDTDDYLGHCSAVGSGSGSNGLKHPLMKTISGQLNGITGPDPVIHEHHYRPPHTTTTVPKMRWLLLANSISALLVLIFGAPSQIKTNDDDNGYKIVCYYGAWSGWHKDKGEFTPEKANPNLCTHLMYGFAALDDASSKIKLFDPNLDTGDTDWHCGQWGKGFYRRTVDLRKYTNPKLKVIISIGGWNEGSTKYSTMVSSPDRRRAFVQSVLDHLKLYGFDGLDLDWEYPGFNAKTQDPGDDRTPGNPKDKQNYIALLSELRQAFQPHGYLLSAAVSAGKPTIDISYDVKPMMQYLDFVSVMTYDFHGGSFDNVTGHNAPLYPATGDDEHHKQFTVSYAIDYWLKLGADPNKLIMGMPTYGRSFTLADPNKSGFNAPTVGKGGKAGPYTGLAGTLGYFEICMDRNWKVHRDDVQKVVYAVNGDQWVGYDDIQSFKDKLQFLKQRKLGGAMFWSIDTDDFGGYCGGEKFPLIKSVYRELVGQPGPDPVQVEHHCKYNTTLV
ncbi:probable chitinase 10 [Oppia nitens]|uniref:probable chitinase 10 n=1 Tax=Oppia nitens TaxID=1686743 RepID=UPI0023DBD1CE|nr:probable chitinase 10 [Oppia nitens]